MGGLAMLALTASVSGMLCRGHTEQDKLLKGGDERSAFRSRLYPPESMRNIFWICWSPKNTHTNVFRAKGELPLHH